MSLALGFLIVLLVGLIGGIFAKKFRQPLILGYLVSGILFGSLPLFPINKEDLLSLAQMGIALLMFSVGTELSLGSLAQVKKLVAVGALIQVFLITILIGAILSFFGFSLPASLFLGFCFSLSSTAVITKILFDQGNEGTFTAEVMVGWLLFQDLLTLAVMALLPSFSPDANLVLTSSLADLMRAGGFILACFFLGKKFFPRIINQIANLSSREILLLATLALCFGLALLGSLFGLSLAMGAFLAGLIISPILSSRAMFAEIRPVRDILAVIFFVLLGMTVNLSFLFQNLGLSVVVSLAVIFLKFLLVFVIILLFGNHLRVAFTAALALSLPAGGEFAFILAVAGATLGVIENSQFSLVVAVAILTMLATPVILARTAPLYRRFRHTVKPWLNRFGRACDDVSLAAPALEEEGLPIENHVVILGFGRVGAWVGRALQMAKI
ncbi:hypothetical protein FJZ40_04975, partial [Candidatus Shapirobacteria bacterium]|nr:hypothetical protein [Candidatus Shapirobacteria bacterium]